METSSRRGDQVEVTRGAVVEPSGALARAGRAAIALGQKARRARRGWRGRRVEDRVAFHRRPGARAWRIFLVVSFVLVFLLPSAGAIGYFGWLASPQYVVETRFTVQSGAPPRVDSIGTLVGIPAQSIAQDTQVVADYIVSRSMVEALQERIDLRGLYSRDGIDWIARLAPDDSIERLVDYWKSMTDVSIQISSGIVAVRVRAFSAPDALRIMETVVTLSESLVNEINRRMRRDQIASAEDEFARANRRLVQARLELQRARDAEGMLDAGQTGKALGDLLTQLRAEGLRLRQDYETQLKSVNASAPQMRELETRLRVISEHIRELEAKLTNRAVPAAPGSVVSVAISRFAERDIERRIAEKQYASATAALEAARIVAERKLVYIAAFLGPALPESARYPKRWLWSLGTVGGALMAWFALCGFAAAVRNHMA